MFYLQGMNTVFYLKRVFAKQLIHFFEFKFTNAFSFIFS